MLDSDQIVTAYVVDIDGTALGVAARIWSEDATPANLAELDAVVESLRFEPGAAPPPGGEETGQTAPTGTPAAVPTEDPEATYPAEVTPAAFAGGWEATDPPPDSSQLTMEVVALADGTYELTTRVAEAVEPGTLVIEQPDYVCRTAARRRPSAVPRSRSSCET